FVDIKSLVTPKAIAQVGNSGGSKGKQITLINTDLSFAHAKENQASTAGIYGNNRMGTVNANNLRVWTDNINQESYTYASSNAAANYGFATLGNLDARAIASDDFSSVLEKVEINATGRVDIYAWTNSHSVVRGGVPGGFALIDGGRSYTNADIGEANDPQTAQILVGDGVKINANQLEMYTRNTSNADANMERGGAYSLAKVEVSNQPTHTYLTTNLLIGKNVELNAKDWMSIYARDYITAKSIMQNESKGIILNVAVMKGENYLTENMMLDIGDNTKLTSGGKMEITTQSTANMDARTEYKNESYGVIGAASSTAINQTNRQVRLQLHDGMSASADYMDIWSRLGENDHIYTFAKNTVRSAIEVPSSHALNDAYLYNAINTGNVNLTSNRELWLYAFTGGLYEPRGDVDAATSVKLVGKPTGVSENNLTVNNEVNLNENGTSRATLTSKTNAIIVRSRLQNLHLYDNSFVEASGALGFAKNECINTINGGVRVWVDNTQFNAQHGGTHINADFGDAFFEEKSEAAVYAITGSETARTELNGSLFARILTTDKSKVSANGYFGHAASNSYRHYYENKCTGWKLVVGYREKEFPLSTTYQCDLCNDITVLDWSKAFDDPGFVTRTTYGAANNSGWHLGSGSDRLNAAFSKALSPINDVNRMVSGKGDITKARYGEEEEMAANAIYVLDIQAMLKRDVTFGEDTLERYRLWMNSQTQQDVYLLPNSTHLFRGAKLDYVAEVLRGDVRGNGESHLVDIYTALNSYAFQHPVVPVGSTASLDFLTGALTLPTLSDYEIYLREVSGEWLLGSIRKGLIRRMDAPVDDVNAFALNGAETLPTGSILEGITYGGEQDGWKLYWLGATPDTAESDEQTLVGLLHNEETDELQAFRTSRAMMAAGEENITVSLYIFRDSRADRMGEEKYDIMVFDTPEGEASLVKAVTNVLDGREMELPKTLKVTLRPFQIDGADMPAYSLTDHFFILCDGTDGEVSLFDGFYTNTFDGDTFDSDYLRIEGIVDDELNVTIKKDQPVWPEKTDDTHATDLNGTNYELVDGAWQIITDAQV
ncbi:MAG: hypothetical protein IJI53_06615, partial [Clostridia bacterium]|nr:hypothetical protein [Clostridia bacterium]